MTMSPTAASNPSASLRRVGLALGRGRPPAGFLLLGLAAHTLDRVVILNCSTASAMAPISSLAAEPGQHQSEVAGGELVHVAHHSAQRPGHAAGHQQGHAEQQEPDQPGAEQHQPAERRPMGELGVDDG